MSEVPKSSDAAQTSGDATNPFAPIDYTSRLKAPVRHTGAFHAMQPLQPGQLYGTAHWMTPPKPLPSFPASQESAAPSAEQNPPVFSAPFPSYMDSPAAEPTPQSAPAASDIPPYLQRRPAIGRTAAQAQPQEEAKVAPYHAADVQEPSPASGAQPEAQASAAQPGASAHPRRSRVARHQLEAAQANTEDTAAPFAAPLPPLPEMPSGFSFQPARDGTSAPEAPLFPAGGEPGAPYAPPLQPGAPYRPGPTDDAAPFGQEPPFPAGGEPGALYAPPLQPGAPYRPGPAEDAASFEQEPPAQPMDEVGAFFSDAEETPAAEEHEMPAPPLRDPFAPAANTVPQAEASRIPAGGAPANPPPCKPAAHSPSAARPQRPPVRPARVVALIAAFMMVVFCLVQGSRILTDLARNEREMEDVREDFLERTGMELQSGAARVDLLPAGQTYVPSPTSAVTQAVQTPSPTPIIPIRENAIQSLNKRDTSNVQEVSAPTDTPSPRTRLSEYPGNPLKNIMESLLPLLEENEEVVGRLTIPGVLDEVVVQRNNTYYLTHNYRGSSSDAGAVFVDESCSLRSPPENLLLRGQSGIEGKVFAPLWQYATAGRDFVASATAAHLTTLYEEADYVLFAVIVASSNPSSPDYFNYAGYTSFVTDADMLSYVESARAHSLYSFNVDVTASDRLLTLATLGNGTESLVLLFRQMR